MKLSEIQIMSDKTYDTLKLRYEMNTDAKEIHDNAFFSGFKLASVYITEMLNIHLREALGEQNETK